MKGTDSTTEENVQRMCKECTGFLVPYENRREVTPEGGTGMRIYQDYLGFNRGVEEK